LFFQLFNETQPPDGLTIDGGRDKLIFEIIEATKKNDEDKNNNNQEGGPILFLKRIKNRSKNFVFLHFLIVSDILKNCKGGKFGT